MEFRYGNSSSNGFSESEMFGDIQSIDGLHEGSSSGGSGDPSGVIGAIGAVISSIVGAISAKRQQSRANAFNREMSDLQWQRELENRDYQNEWNSPAAQRARLEAAGYNAYQGLQNYQSADSAAPDAKPYAEIDTAAHSANIGDRLANFFEIMTSQQKLRYQKLKNDEQSIMNEYLGDRLFRGNESIMQQNIMRNVDYYNKLVRNGVDPDHAKGLAFGSKDAVSFLSDGEAEILLDTAENNRKRSKWAAKQEKLGYQFMKETYADRYQSVKLGNYATSAQVNELGRKMKFLHQTDKIIDGWKGLTPYEKSCIKMMSQSMVYNGLPDSINPFEWVRSIVGARAGAAKKIMNSYDTNNFNMNSKNIILPLGH